MKPFGLSASGLLAVTSLLSSTKAQSPVHGTYNLPPTYCTPKVISTLEQASRFDAFVHSLYITKNLTNAYGGYVSLDYIQHNPFVGQGPAASIECLSHVLPKANITIFHLGLDNGVGWVHWRAIGLGPEETAITDVFRWNGSCIVEHWDVVEARPANATNPLAFF